MGSVTPNEQPDFPPLASLAKDIYRPLPTIPKSIPSTIDAHALLTNALNRLSTGLSTNSLPDTQSCFLNASPCFWRDHNALTWHLRTLSSSGTIAAALLTLSRAREASLDFEVLPQSVQDVVVSPTLRWVEGMFRFETRSPAAKCGGKVMLVPEEDGEWRIWSMATWADDLVEWPEDEGLLTTVPQKSLDVERIDTEVFIIGAGNAGVILAACLKARGVESVVVEKNPRPGDNWALRYDCLRFHIGKHSCNPPFYPYPDDYPLILTRDMLAEHMRNYAAKYHLNILCESRTVGSSFNKTKGVWTVKVQTPYGVKIVRAKHLVQSTGLGGDKPYRPQLPGEDTYKGLNIHSAQYKNPTTLSDKGAKSAIVVGSANSAFDVLEDLVAASHPTTMIARSPTYVFPWEYALDPNGLGLYERLPADLCDALQMSLPIAITGPLLSASYAHMAAQEPERYKPLAEAGFPVYDSMGGRGDLWHHIFERGGGHFNDIGEGIAMILDGRAKVKANVEPVEYTETGLRFSDGQVVEADAIVWCTGFNDKERSTTVEKLGGEKFVLEGTVDPGDEVLGPEDIAALRDAVWGVDIEGEVRGVWRRHEKLDNFWIAGGGTNHHRYYGKFMALQLKLALEGKLPEAYRDTPEVK